MTSSAGQLHLSKLEQTRALSLDPSIWTENLVALRVAQPEAAALLEGALPPADWRACEALDGSHTYRVERAGQPPVWISGSALPRRRAEALLASVGPGDSNPALASPGSGAEVRVLLDRLSPTQAIYVFAQDPAEAAALLRATPLAGEIRTLRCVVVPGGDPLGLLQRLLERVAGLLPPGNLIRFLFDDAARVATVRQVCEQLGGRIAAARQSRLAALAAEPIPAHAPGDVPRLFVAALRPAHDGRCVARQLDAALDELGWHGEACAVETPADVHPLRHALALRDVAPQLVLAIQHGREALAAAGNVRVAAWILDAADLIGRPTPAADWYLAATPGSARALREAGIADSQIVPLSLAAGSAVRRPAGPPRNDQVLLIADRPDASAAACRIELSTHEQIWRALHAVAAASWSAGRLSDADSLLREALRAANVELREETLRQGLLRLIENVLVPATACARLLDLLVSAGLRVSTVGRGWQERPPQGVTPLGADLLDLGRIEFDTAPLAAIVVTTREGSSSGSIPARQCAAILEAGLLGLPLLVHRAWNDASAGRGGITLDAGGPGVGGDTLLPDQHYRAAGDARELKAALEECAARGPGLLRRIERVQTLVRTRHTYAQRLQTLAAVAGLVSGEGER